MKGSYSISYADAFALGLAREFGGELVTRDPEILRVTGAAEFTVHPIPEE
ncbi:MAG: hypothetical protein H5U00_08260 [Clostridia bacterium]|nr:hypothetical protein [Clostridia bacterium]